MKVLIIGGMHGNEPLGIELVNQLQRQPVKNVDVLIANSNAVQITIMALLVTAHPTVYFMLLHFLDYLELSLPTTTASTSTLQIVCR